MSDKNKRRILPLKLQRYFLNRKSDYHLTISAVSLISLLLMIFFPNLLEKNYPFKYIPSLNIDRDSNNFKSLSPSDAPSVLSRREPLNCSRIIPLAKFCVEHSQPEQAFFLETSGKSYLDGRQSCSVESAAVKSGLVSKVLLRTSVLDLSKSKPLCELYYNYPNVQFYSVDITELFRNTPAEGLEKRVEKVVAHDVCHYSAIGRMAFAYKYGGVYLDLDIIVLRRLTHIKNSIVLESAKPAMSISQSDMNCAIQENSQRAQKINNGHFHFESGHPFAYEVLKYVNQTYDPNLNFRGQSGPIICSRVAKHLYGLRELRNVKIESPNGDFTMLPDFTFMPASFSRIKEELWPRNPRDPADWNDLFRCSLAVHFHSNVFGSVKVTQDPTRDAISFLGPILCPRSYLHVNEF